MLIYLLIAVAKLNKISTVFNDKIALGKGSKNVFTPGSQMQFLIATWNAKTSFSWYFQK